MKKDMYKINLDNSFDYEGKLNIHEDYLKMLDILEKNCSFIGITSFGGMSDIIEKFKDDIIHTEESSSWWGIETSSVTTLYYIKSSKELFDFLKKYETFCKTISSEEVLFGEVYTKDKVEHTDFGINDIAFFDEKNNILLRTNTHEGFIFVDEMVDKIFRDS